LRVPSPPPPPRLSLSLSLSLSLRPLFRSPQAPAGSRASFWLHGVRPEELTLDFADAFPSFWPFFLFAITALQVCVCVEEEGGGPRLRRAFTG